MRLVWARLGFTVTSTEDGISKWEANSDDLKNRLAQSATNRRLNVHRSKPLDQLRKSCASFQFWAPATEHVHAVHSCAAGDAMQVESLLPRASGGGHAFFASVEPALVASPPVAGFPHGKSTGYPLGKSGARHGLAVKRLEVGKGHGLFTNQDIPAHGFICMYRGEFMWRPGGGASQFPVKSVYATETDRCWIVPRVTTSSLNCYPASRVNEPSAGETANAVSKTWTDAGDLLAGASGAIECLALHAGPNIIKAGTQVLWYYGGCYHRNYTVGAACSSAGIFETPAAYFGSAEHVPGDAFRWTTLTE